MQCSGLVEVLEWFLALRGHEPTTMPSVLNIVCLETFSCFAILFHFIFILYRKNISNTDKNADASISLTDRPICWFIITEQSSLYDNNHYHEECLRCNSCGINLSGTNQVSTRYIDTFSFLLTMLKEYRKTQHSGTWIQCVSDCDCLPIGCKPVLIVYCWLLPVQLDLGNGDTWKFTNSYH